MVDAQNVTASRGAMEARWCAGRDKGQGCARASVACECTSLASPCAQFWCLAIPLQKELELSGFRRQRVSWDWREDKRV